MGDVWISLAPVLAGVLITLSGYPIFDPIIAGLIAIWFIGSTLKELISSHEELIWPEELQRESPGDPPAKPAVERGPGAPRG